MRQELIKITVRLDSLKPTVRQDVLAGVSIPKVEKYEVRTVPATLITQREIGEVDFYFLASEPETMGELRDVADPTEIVSVWNSWARTNFKNQMHCELCR
jgi:hypothetical protein